MKKILITGGSGFIGTNLINFFLKKKFKIINLDLLSYASTPDKFKDFYKNKNYILVKGNIGDKQKVENILKKNDIYAIFNLASYTHVDRSIENPKEFIKQNFMSNIEFINTINFSMNKNLFKGKFINISTDEVYGSVLKNPSKENSPLEPNSPYSASKASVDLVLRAYNKTFNLPFINVRCCNNYGPYQFSEKFIPTIINCIFQNKKIPIYGDGKYYREWIFVDDFCSALNSILLKGSINNIYNVGSGERISNTYLTNNIIKICNKIFNQKISNKFVKFVKDRPGHDRSYKIDSSKLRTQTKWKSLVTLEYGLLKTVLWYSNNIKWLNYTKKKYDGKRLGLK